MVSCLTFKTLFYFDALADAVVGASALEPKNLQFNSQSRAYTWVTDSIPLPSQGTNRRQPVDVSYLSHEWFSLLPLPLPSSLSL